MQKVPFLFKIVGPRFPFFDLLDLFLLFSLHFDLVVSVDGDGLFKCYDLLILMTIAIVLIVQFFY